MSATPSIIKSRKASNKVTSPAAVLAALDLPIPEHTAFELARLGAGLPGPDNRGRSQLRLVVGRLGDGQDEAPDLHGAFDAAVAGVRHAFRPEYTEERPESYLLAACTELLACALYEPSAPPEGLAGASLPPVASHGHQPQPAP